MKTTDFTELVQKVTKPTATITTTNSKAQGRKENKISTTVLHYLNAEFQPKQSETVKEIGNYGPYVRGKKLINRTHP
jgi:hypothetical protein